MSDPRYPIGKFAPPAAALTPAQRRQFIDDIAAVPARLRELANGLTERQLATPYRDGGWTIRQVIHHVPDSHLNAYLRLKWALTENEPTIKPYDEAAWAELPDTRDTPVETSLVLLEKLHDRWTRLLRSLSDTDFARRFRHPDHGMVDIDWLIAMYAWHGKHHTAHVKQALERQTA